MQYLQRQHPALLNAEKFYDNLDIDPSIPSTIFTETVFWFLNCKPQQPWQTATTPQSNSNTESSLHTATCPLSSQLMPSCYSIVNFNNLNKRPPLHNQILTLKPPFTQYVPRNQVHGPATLLQKPTNLSQTQHQLPSNCWMMENQTTNLNGPQQMMRLSLNALYNLKNIEKLCSPRKTSYSIAGRTTIEQQSKKSAVTGYDKSNNSNLTIESAHLRLETIEIKVDSIPTMLMIPIENYKPT